MTSDNEQAVAPVRRFSRRRVIVYERQPSRFTEASATVIVTSDGAARPAAATNKIRPDSPSEKARRWLKKKFPAVFGKAYLPLALGTMQAILAAPGRPKDVSATALRKAVAARCHHGAYLAALRKGTARHALDGAPSGEISEKDKQVAREWMKARRKPPKP